MEGMRRIARVASAKRLDAAQREAFKMRAKITTCSSPFEGDHE
tara:strand:+ start:1039 stop:1167 length:129 start_codon:yes stop_codon:yes gene_type:complete